MSNFHRRDFLKGAAALAGGMTAALVGASQVEAGEPSFMNNVPDPLLSGKDLPTFKFALEKSKAKVTGKSTAREATVEGFQISKGIAGVSMGLEPGAMRELHWHATAAEWAYVDQGRVRTTVIDPQGHSETNDFEPGDIWYFPRGHAHMLECLGDKPCHFILIFDNGYIPQGYGHPIENVGDKPCRVLIGLNTGHYEAIDLSQWIAGNPTDVLATNFGKPAALFENFPHQDVFIAAKDGR